MEDELAQYKKQRQQLTGTMEKLVGYLETKDKSQSTPANDNMDQYIKQVADYSEKMQDDNVLNTMSPESKEVYVNALKTRRKNVLKKMAESNNN